MKYFPRGHNAERTYYSGKYRITKTYTQEAFPAVIDLLKNGHTLEWITRARWAWLAQLVRLGDGDVPFDVLRIHAGMDSVLQEIRDIACG